MWDILSVIIDDRPGELQNKVIHVTDIVSAQESRAHQLLTAQPMSMLGTSLSKKEDRLIESAKIFLKLGNFREFCEIQMKLSNYEKALAYAPAVSMEYWQECAERYTQHLDQQKHEDLPLACLLSHQVSRAIDVYKQKGDYEDGKLVQILDSAQLYKEVPAQYRAVDVEGPLNIPKFLKTFRLEEHANLSEFTEKQAHRYFEMCSPLLSASSHLSMNDVTNTLVKLIRSNELYFAFEVASFLQKEALPEIQRRLLEWAERDMDKYVFTSNIPQRCVRLAPGENRRPRTEKFTLHSRKDARMDREFTC